MLSRAFALLSTYFAIAASRETIRPMPTITNSLVNLGKMEISFYFNGNAHDSPSRVPDHSSPASSFFPKSEPIFEEAPCPCSSFRNFKDSFLTNPTGLLNKILMNNDLFSFNKDPYSSTLCCDSHEHIQEGTVVFELSPPIQHNVKPMNVKSGPARSSSSLPMVPFLFDSPIPNKSMLPPLKTKAIEIFLFPKKKGEMGVFDLSKYQPKKKDTTSSQVLKDIAIVGDKKLENNINMFIPPLPTPPKKQVTVQEKIDKMEKEEKERENEKQAEEGETKIIIEPASKPNAV